MRSAKHLGVSLKTCYQLFRSYCSNVSFISYFTTMRKAYRAIERLATLQIENNSRGVNRAVFEKLADGIFYVFGMAVKGDIAEFGTMTGRTAVALASSLKNCQKTMASSDVAHGLSQIDRKLWLFDSFSGLPQARFDIDRNSPHVQSGCWGENACRGLTKLQLESLMRKYLRENQFLVVEGWFKDSVKNIPANTLFSLIHLDGDLYESAIDVLDYLFSKKMISDGAIIFFDDWNCNHASQEMGERRAFHEVVEKYKVNFSDGCAYGVACHKFIIHSYS